MTLRTSTRSAEQREKTPAQLGTSTAAAGSLAWKPLRESDMALTEQLVTYLKQHIQTHQLRAGVRLPSVRAMADGAAVSRDTVVQAYDRLVALGLIHSRRGAGFFVRPQNNVSMLDVPQAQEDAPSDGRRIDTTFLLRSMFEQGARAESAGNAGLLPPHWLEPEMLTAAIRHVGRTAGQSLSGYGIAQGYLPLRQQIADGLQAQDVPAHAENNVMTVAGVTHGLDLIVRLLVRPGDTVLVEDPAWFLVFARLEAIGAKVVGVPRNASGPDVQALQALAAQYRPRLFILNTAVHNPTGQTLSAVAAHAILKVAEEHNFLLVEDDTYSDFHPATPVRLAALDGLQRVLLVGGYAKTLSGAIRVGYVAAHADWLRQLVDVKLLGGLTSSQLGEMVVQRILVEGQYRKHVDRLRAKVDRARDLCLRRVEQLGWHVPMEPRAGMFVWADCGMDSEALAQKAARHGLLLAPGMLFSPVQSPSQMLRIAVPLAHHAKSWDTLAALSDA